MISLAGEWNVILKGGAQNTCEAGTGMTINLPGTIGGSGLGEKITRDTEWFSGLYNPFWYERVEYKSGAGEDFKVPFLSQPRTYYAGKAVYERDFEIPEAECASASPEWYLLIEISKWRVTAEIDGVNIGEDESLCAPFMFGPVELNAGKHHIKVTVDNSMLYPYRPDSHSVSDCLEAGWNGMAGRIGIIGKDEKQAIEAGRKKYADEHPVSAEVVGNNIVINGKAEYMRGTHFGGGFHETVYPPFDRPYWDRLMKTVGEWGFNFIRFHSFCPPEAAFAAADEAGIFLQVECGMWNVFNSENDEMFAVLMKETRRILEWFGHHPSFVMLSPTNEPGGNWYDVLKKWVVYAKEINSELGYEGRRLFTAQSGWFYDTPPADITGTDYIYFHRSAYGPIHGGMIRNRWGWRGKDYSPSLPGCRLPVIAHEMGQWCAYPDFGVIDKFTGGIRGGNYEIYRDNAAEHGVLKFNRDFVYASGRAQLRLLKEDFEANFRTKEIVGFEYLDLHDYPGQGTAQVGVLDAFLDNKGYTSPEEFRRFNSELVVLSRTPGYVYKNSDTFEADIEICNFSGKELKGAKVVWAVRPYENSESRDVLIAEAYEGGSISDFGRKGSAADSGCDNLTVTCCGRLAADEIKPGQNTSIGHIDVDLGQFGRSTKALFSVALISSEGTVKSVNYWDLTIFAETDSNNRLLCTQTTENMVGFRNDDKPGENVDIISNSGIDGIYYVRTADQAEYLLKAGKTVVFSPYMSDMDFECPSLGIRNVFWNAQMGPSWSRPLGIIVDTESPVFKHFPTEKAGGWEWEDILEHARGFNFDPGYANIVRVVDDWNRNFPLSLIFEGRVFNGRLLFCSADLGGTFAERPAAVTLKNALVGYAASKDFNPGQEIRWADVLKHIKPLYKGMDIIREVTSDADIPGEELMKLTDINPNIPFRFSPESLPVCFRIRLAEKVRLERLYMLPIQNDRDFPGVVREYGIRVNGREIRGEWKNGFETQYSEIIGETADELEFIVYSTYSMGPATRWYEEPEGYIKRTATEPVQITAAALGIEYDADEPGESGSDRDYSGERGSDRDERSEGRRDGIRHDDAPFWKGEVVRLGVTIEQ